MPKFEAARIDLESHPGYSRLLEKGFRVLGESASTILAEPGVKMVFFVDDPNRQRETLDMVVIASEIKDLFSGIEIGCFITDVRKARALAASFGIRKLPSIGFWSNEEFLGSIDGLQNWDDYMAKIPEVLTRTKGPERTIAILSNSPEE